MQEMIAKRLKKARQDAGYKTAREAAAALGVAYQTYASHENASRGFDPETGAKYAKRFKVTMDWLVGGRGDSAAMPSQVPLMGYVGAGAEVEPDFEQVPQEGLETIDVPFALPADMVAFQVKGDSMLPQFSDGMVIIVFREQRRAIETFYGEQAIVRTADGRRFVKTIERGPNGGYTLNSWNARPIENVQPVWIGEIFTYFPASAVRRAARKIDKQGGLQGQLRLRA